MREFHRLLLDLLRELARRRHHQRVRAPRRDFVRHPRELGDVRQHRHDERARLPRARLGDADHVALQQADGDRSHLNGRGRVVPHLANRAQNLGGHPGLAPAPHRRRKTPAARRDVVVLAEDAPVALGHLRRRLLGPVSSLRVRDLWRRDPRAAAHKRRLLVRDAPGARVAAGLGDQRHLPPGALLGDDAAVHAGARAAAERQRALVWPIVQGVQVRGSVLVLVPVEFELELVTGLRDFLLRLRAAHVLRADQLQFALARARLVERVAVASMVEPSVVGRFAERERARPNPGWGPRVVRASVPARRHLLLSSFQRGGFSILLAHERRARGRLRLGLAFPHELFQG